MSDSRNQDWNDLTVNVHRHNEHFPIIEDENRNGLLFIGHHVCPGGRHRTEGFGLFAPILLLALFFNLKFLPNTSKLTRPKVDFVSGILSIFGFGLLVMGFSFAARLGWTSPVVLGCLVGGILIVAVYAYRQLHHENPILNLKVFKHVAFTKGTLLVMIDFGIILSAMYLLPQYIQRGMLVPVTLTGIIMLPGGIVNAALSGLAGRMFDKYGAKILATIGFIIAIIGAIMLLNVSTHTSVPTSSLPT